MWNLNVAEGNGPCLFSTNNFIGRQIWQYDPNAGTPEEREEVEQAREHYKNNCKDGRERALPSGDLLMRMQIIALYVTGTTDTILTGEHIKELIRHIYLHQNNDGGWGLYIEGSSTMIGTILNYVSLRLLGEGPNAGQNREMANAREWIQVNGGSTATASWGKFFLAVLGLYEWSGCNPLPPEIWLFPSSFTAKMWCNSHSTFMSMSYLYGRKFQGPITNLVMSMRQEIYTESYRGVNWNLARNTCSKALQLMCWWAEDPSCDEFKYQLARVPNFLWLAEDGMKVQSFGSQNWDCALMTQALIASSMVDEYSDSLKKAHFFIIESQIKENPAGDFKSMQRHFTRGGWTFSDRDHGWIGSDSTAEPLKCLLLLSQMSKEIAGEKADLERLYEAVDVLLYLQNSKNGGFSAWEPPVSLSYLEVSYF